MRNASQSVEFMLDELNEELFENGLIYSKNPEDYEIVIVKLLKAENLTMMINMEMQHWKNINPNYDMDIYCLEKYLSELTDYYQNNRTKITKGDLKKSEQVTELNLHPMRYFNIEPSSNNNDYKLYDYLGNDYKDIEEKCNNAIDELKELKESR